MTDGLRVQRGTVSGMDSIAIAGAFDSNDPEVDAIVQQIIDEGKRQVAFDLGRVTYMTSPGIACIIKALNKMRAIGGTLFVHGATDDMLDLLRLTRLGEYLQIV